MTIVTEIRAFRSALAAAPALATARLLTALVVLFFYSVMLDALVRTIAPLIAMASLYGLADFDTMWKGGLLIRAGQMRTLYDRPLFDVWLQHRFGGQLADESWLYTPPMGLLAALVSLTPMALSFWLWTCGTVLAAAFLLRRAGLGWWVIFAGLLGPAEVYNLLLGQNGALTGGLLVGSLLMMNARPRLAGVLAGCLCVKPQIAVLLPAVLLWPRHARALLACGLTVALLALAATWLQGGRAWPLFFTLAQPNAGRLLAIPFGHSFQMAGVTVFLMARSLGLGLHAAWIVQAACSACAGGAVWALWGRRYVDNVARMAMTVCLSVLAMPYGFSYDLVAFSIAMAALVPRAAPASVPVLAVLWFWPGVTSALTMDTGVVLMPLAALLGCGVAALQLSPATLTMRSGLANPLPGFD